MIVQMNTERESNLNFFVLNHAVFLKLFSIRRDEFGKRAFYMEQIKQTKFKFSLRDPVFDG